MQADPSRCRYLQCTTRQFAIKTAQMNAKGGFSFRPVWSPWCHVYRVAVSRAGRRFKVISYRPPTHLSQYVFYQSQRCKYAWLTSEWNQGGNIVALLNGAVNNHFTAEKKKKKKMGVMRRLCGPKAEWESIISIESFTGDDGRPAHQKWSSSKPHAAQ